MHDADVSVAVYDDEEIKDRISPLSIIHRRRMYRRLTMMTLLLLSIIMIVSLTWWLTGNSGSMGSCAFISSGTGVSFSSGGSPSFDVIGIQVAMIKDGSLSFFFLLLSASM